MLVPVGSEADYYYAGEYHEPLIFQFEGHTISGEAVDANGMPLKPGDQWRGGRGRAFLILWQRAVKTSITDTAPVTEWLKRSSYPDRSGYRQPGKWPGGNRYN